MPPKANHDARMLDRIILIEQSRANCADVLTLAETQHLLDEILRDQLSVSLFKNSRYSPFAKVTPKLLIAE